MAYIATAKHEDALDIVQDAMFTLAKRYADKSEDEWPALFHRIVQNKIRDRYRRQQVRQRIFFWQRNAQDAQQPTGEEQLEQGVDHEQPADVLQNAELSAAIEQALGELPVRQQQTFLLRAWQGLSVSETADAMQISEGSVKTHYSRALAALKQQLQSYRA